eukprot:3504610-Amphidinium_carterae.1
MGGTDATPPVRQRGSTCNTTCPCLVERSWPYEDHSMLTHHWFAYLIFNPLAWLPIILYPTTSSFHRDLCSSLQ